MTSARRAAARCHRSPCLRAPVRAKWSRPAAPRAARRTHGPEICASGANFQNLPPKAAKFYSRDAQNLASRENFEIQISKCKFRISEIYSSKVKFRIYIFEIQISKFSRDARFRASRFVRKSTQIAYFCIRMPYQIFVQICTIFAQIVRVMAKICQGQILANSGQNLSQTGQVTAKICAGKFWLTFHQEILTQNLLRKFWAKMA